MRRAACPYTVNTSSSYGALVISHDLALVQHLCDRVIVMYQGNIVEQGRTERVINAPENGYTKMLIEAAMLGQ